MGTDVYEKSNLALKVRNLRMVFKQLLWQILPKQSVGVFVRSTLPRTPRVTAVNVYIGGDREALKTSHLQLSVPCE